MLWQVMPIAACPLLVTNADWEPLGSMPAPAVQRTPTAAPFPVCVQFFAFAELQLIVNCWPGVRIAGLVDIDTVGAGGGSTCRVTGVAVAEADEPTPPVQVIETT